MNTVNGIQIHNVVEFISIINARVGVSLLALVDDAAGNVNKEMFFLLWKYRFQYRVCRPDCKDCRIFMIFAFHISLHVKYPE